MGDSEDFSTDQRRPPAPASQIGAVCNSSLRDSQVTIVNVINYYSVQYQPEQREPCTVQRPEDAGQRPEDAGQYPDEPEQRPEDAGQCPEDTGQRPEDTGQCPEEPGQQPDDTGQRPEDPGQRPEDPGQRPEDPGQRPEDPGQRPEEDELDGDSDEHKELINSFSLSGSHERQRSGSIQDPVCYPGDFDEIKFEDAKLATGWPMPLSYCRIAPHQCEVHGHSSTSLKLPQWLRRRVFKQVVLCLVGNTVCISKTTEKPIESVVDITKGPFHLNGNKLTAGSLVVTVPQNKIFKWQEVIDAMK